MSTRNYGQKDQRLEHLSWRVWFMKRARSRVAWEEGHRIAATIPDESDAFEDYTSEEDDSVRGSSKDGKESPRNPSSPSKQLGGALQRFDQLHDSRVRFIGAHTMQLRVLSKPTHANLQGSPHGEVLGRHGQLSSVRLPLCGLAGPEQVHA